MFLSRLNIDITERMEMYCKVSFRSGEQRAAFSRVAKAKGITTQMVEPDMDYEYPYRLLAIKELVPEPEKLYQLISTVRNELDSPKAHYDGVYEGMGARKKKPK